MAPKNLSKNTSMEKNKKTVLITGASAGFGEAIAYRLATDNYRLILSGRREDRLEKVKNLIVKQSNAEVITLAFDVRDKQAVNDSINNLPSNWKDIDVLINNAGLAVGLNPIHEGEIDDWERMIDTNIKGLLYVTRVVAPQMVARKCGHIINIGSIAAKEVYPNGNVYCGTKHAVDALSKGMRIDLLPYGIKVTAIHPGLAETEFSIVRFKGNEERAKSVYMGYTPLYANDIADIASFVISRPEHVGINEIVVTPTAQANSVFKHTI